MNYAEILGHEPSPATIAIIERLSEYVDREHNAHPDIPRESYWAALQAELKAMIGEE